MAGKSSEVVFDYQNHKILVPPAGMLGTMPDDCQHSSCSWMESGSSLAPVRGGAGAPCRVHEAIPASDELPVVVRGEKLHDKPVHSWIAPLAFFLGSLISVPNACLGSISAMLYLMRYSSPIPPSSTRSNQSAMWGGTASPTVRRSGDLGCPLPADV